MADGDLVFDHKENLGMWWQEVKVEAGHQSPADDHEPFNLKWL